MSETRTVDPKKRVGQIGESWGNLLLPDGEMERDEEFVFEGDGGEKTPKRFWVTRINAYPLDTAKRLYYYERVPRWRHPPAE